MVMELQALEGKNKAVGGNRINQRGTQFKTFSSSADKVYKLSIFYYYNSNQTCYLIVIIIITIVLSAIILKRRHCTRIRNF